MAEEFCTSLSGWKMMFDMENLYSHCIAWMFLCLCIYKHRMASTSDYIIMEFCSCFIREFNSFINWFSQLICVALSL